MTEVLNIEDHSQILRGKNEEISLTNISQSVLEAIDDLKEASRTAGGLGMAAPQIGHNIRAFVMEPRQPGEGQLVVLNPEIVATSGKVTSHDEGCLSVPGQRFTIKRARQVVLKGHDEDGKEIRIKSRNKTEAIIIQHEMDHLNGVLVCDR